MIARFLVPVGSLLLACGSPRPAPEPLGATPPERGIERVGSCERDSDCILLRGPVCSDCGGCRGDTERALPVAALRQERDACPADAPAPECSACGPVPRDWLERKAVCVAGTCALEPPLGFR